MKAEIRDFLNENLTPKVILLVGIITLIALWLTGVIQIATSPCFYMGVSEYGGYTLLLFIPIALLTAMVFYEDYLVGPTTFFVPVVVF